MEDRTLSILKSWCEAGGYADICYLTNREIPFTKDFIDYFSDFIVLSINNVNNIQIIPTVENNISLPLIDIKNKIFSDNKIKIKTKMVDDLLLNYDSWVVKDEWIDMLYKENNYPVALSIVLLKFIPKIVINKITEKGEELW